MKRTFTGPIPRPGIMDIDAYVPGRSSIPGVVQFHKLSSNENPFGASPKVFQVMRNTVFNFERYPDGSSYQLRQAIGKVYGIDSANIVCGNGSDELLDLLCKAYLGPGDEAIITEYGYLLYKIQIKAMGATPITVQEKNYVVDVHAILSAVTERTKIIFISNPGNPTGTYVPVKDLFWLISMLPDHVLLVIDSAYGEYVRKDDYDSGLKLVNSSTNVVMTRTFSKAYGLAALRIGWLYTNPSVVNVLNRIRNPFNLNSIAIAIGTVAVNDQEFIRNTVEFNIFWREKMIYELDKIGLKVTPSVANFLLIHFPNKDGKRAIDADNFLTSRGYILRALDSYGLPNALRMSIGCKDANEGVINVLKEFMA
ncbi:Biosynthetic Aromatic amino acid aminotransferase beta [Liberibacter crescens BT-1]|uniref:Histidinol-phosphate aminotransferase n=1 Tax=Liberibacter crescens (strain BT-1) TaxID=1215343 RepID=L0EVY3_LIBCB|nr:histidinol-phosphate transaminase [Liberibacter crescens]AGA65117.1 Biosynthetic Aromatic amino acid aminotransferase beta [Liberibacter crescens BT-1]AMC13090.1 histidinol-phosphate aminotransferase [Liberibacter crescens]